MPQGPFGLPECVEMGKQKPPRQGCFVQCRGGSFVFYQMQEVLTS